VEGEPATLAHIVAVHARRDPDRVALIFEDHSFTYAQLDAAIERAADTFAALGVRPGDRVALMLGNEPAFIAAYYGILRAGAVVVPINPMYRQSEIDHILRDSEPALALVEGSLWPEVSAAFAPPAVPIVRVTNTTNALSWETAMRDAPARDRVWPEPDELAMLVYTSGTTGRAKGAMHSHATLLANCRQNGNLMRRRFGPDDRVLCVLPLCHIFAVQSAMNSMYRVGASVVLMRRFHVSGVLANIERHRCTFLPGAPPMFTRWVELPELGNYDLSSLRVISCGAAPLRASVLETFRSITGVSVSESFGLTEAGPTTHSNSAGPVDKLGTIGPPIPGVECRLVDADGNDVAPGEPGELLVRSPSLMLGYWRNPQATAETIRDGWLRTGDVATVEADGYYTIVDRLKDMIASGGFKIWPLEIEAALLEHASVAEVAVVGIPDADAGERPMAFVVRAPETAVTSGEIVAFAQRSLAKYKVPVRIEFVDALPRLSTGKVLRRELRERARALAETHAATTP
jgi:long-chain acyl-CoA synthetase